MIVVGNAITLKNNSIWNQYLKWVSQNGSFIQYNGEHNTSSNMDRFFSSIFNCEGSQNNEQKKKSKEQSLGPTFSKSSSIVESVVVD